MNSELGEFERLIAALAPWLGQMVVVGGWAHRLYHEHPAAQVPPYAPVRTRDADVAFGARARLTGRISAALANEGFRAELSSEASPPVAQYHLAGSVEGFYAEFLTPLVGGATKRDGSAPSTLPSPLEVRVANPVSYVVQKLLIHSSRTPAKRAQDVLYIHDTIQLFGGSLPELGTLWRLQVRAALSQNQRRGIRRMRPRLFATVSDSVREATLIPVDRSLQPEDVRAVCEHGLEILLADT